MPTIELDIGGTPTRVQVDDGYTPEDLDHIAKTLSVTETPGGRAGSYLYNKANQFIGSMQGVGKDVQNLVTGQPYGAGFPGQRSGWDTAADVATTAAPIIAPEATALGLTAGTYARAKGADEPTADLINAVTAGGSGLLRAGTAAAGLRAATNRELAGIGERMAARGTTLKAASPEGQTLFWALGNATRRFTGAGRTVARNLMRDLASGTNLTYGDLDNYLTQVQEAKAPNAIAGIIRSARNALVAGTPDEGALAAANRSGRLMGKSLPNLLPAGGVLNLQRLGRAGAVLSSTGAAAQQAYHGNYGRAAGILGAGLVGVGNVGQAVAAAPALARTAVSVAGPAIRSLATGDTGGDLGETGGTAPEADITAPEARTPSAPAAPQRPRASIPAGPYGREIAAVSNLAGIPPEVIQAHMHVETGGRNVIGDQGRSFGVMQIQPGTAAVVGKHAGELLGRAPDLMNPFDNILVGGLLLRRYLDKTNGDWNAAAQMYNGGEGTTGNSMTRDYVGKVFAAAGLGG